MKEYFGYDRSRHRSGRSQIVTVVGAMWLLALLSARLPYAIAQPTSLIPELAPDYSSELDSLFQSAPVLSHDEDFPDPGEPIQVLTQYVQGTSDGDIDQRIAQWRSLVQVYPQSRHALVSLAVAYETKADATQDDTYLREAANLYLAATKLAIANGNIRYTHAIETTLVALKDPLGLDAAFGYVLSQPPSIDPVHYYRALVDYAVGLDAFNDDRAATYFEQAVQSKPPINVTYAANLYAQYLLARNQPKKAFEVLDSSLTPQQRIRAILPVFLRKQAALAAGIDISASRAEEKTVTDFLHHSIGIGIEPPGLTQPPPITCPVPPAPNMTHDCRQDDARNPGLGNGIIYLFNLPGTGIDVAAWSWGVNFAEVEYNERGPGSSWGAVDAVGWTIRNRFAMNLPVNNQTGGFDKACADDNNCSSPKTGTSTAGGCGWRNSISCSARYNPSCVTAGGPCKDNQPCSEGAPGTELCFLSKEYICATRGGTFWPVITNNQFADSHVDGNTLWNSGYLSSAAWLEAGFLPDMSTPGSGYWTVGGVNRSTCTFNCDSPACNGAVAPIPPVPTLPPSKIINDGAGSRNGSVEFRSCRSGSYRPLQPSVEYQPSDPSMSWSGGNICNGGNCFYNRCTKDKPAGPECHP